MLAMAGFSRALAVRWDETKSPGIRNVSEGGLHPRLYDFAPLRRLMHGQSAGRFPLSRDFLLRVCDPPAL